MKQDDFFANLQKDLGNEWVVTGEQMVNEENEYVDTGSYTLNALLSGDLFGGLLGNKITVFAGESATGKTFFTLACVKQFLEDNPNGYVFYFDTESAISPAVVKTIGVNANRVAIVPVHTVQEFRTQAIKILDGYIEAKDDKDRPKMMLCLDSLGMLSTTKEIEDTTEGKETRDMTRAQLLRATFRVLTLKLGKAQVPLLVTNHTYDQVGTMFPQKIMTGGQGIRYSADTIVFLSKKKDKVGTEVVGNIIKCKNDKNRLAKENKMVETLINYSTGLSRYFGLLELAERYELVKKVSTRYEFPDGTKAFGKKINEEPEKFFTQEFMEELNKFVQEDFLYGAEEEYEEESEQVLLQEVK